MEIEKPEECKTLQKGRNPPPLRPSALHRSYPHRGAATVAGPFPIVHPVPLYSSSTNFFK